METSEILDNKKNIGKIFFINEMLLEHPFGTQHPKKNTQYVYLGYENINNKNNFLEKRYLFLNIKSGSRFYVLKESLSEFFILKKIDNNFGAIIGEISIVE